MSTKRVVRTLALLGLGAVVVWLAIKTLKVIAILTVLVLIIIGCIYLWSKLKEKGGL